MIRRLRHTLTEPSVLSPSNGRVCEPRPLVGNSRTGASHLHLVHPGAQGAAGCDLAGASGCLPARLEGTRAVRAGATKNGGAHETAPDAPDAHPAGSDGRRASDPLAVQGLQGRASADPASDLSPVVPASRELAFTQLFGDTLRPSSAPVSPRTGSESSVGGVTWRPGARTSMSDRRGLIDTRMHPGGSAPTPAPVGGRAGASLEAPSSEVGSPWGRLFSLGHAVVIVGALGDIATTRRRPSHGSTGRAPCVPPVGQMRARSGDVRRRPHSHLPGVSSRQTWSRRSFGTRDPRVTREEDRDRRSGTSRTR
jgi:hypothetical protein